MQALGEHCAQGRITSAEYEERIGMAWEAKTTPDLQALFTDLPEPRPVDPYRAPPDESPTVAQPLPTAWHPQPPQQWAGGYPPVAYDPAAPYGREPLSGRPYSDKSKVVSGVLQLFLPFGVGRFYSGHVGLGVAQLLVTLFTFGIGALWPFIDGIVILAGNAVDPQGRPLRP